MAGRQLLFELLNQFSEVEQAGQALIEFGESNGLSSDDMFSLNLALEEILVNIISYGYEDDKKHIIHVHLSLIEDEFAITVEDDAKEFNPLDAPEPDIDKPIEERPIGGLGIFLVRKMMDELVYKRSDGKNLLSM